MIEMVQQGKIPVSVAESFRVPAYKRTLDDVKKVLNENTETWAVQSLFEDDITHPAIHDLRNKLTADEEASREYADVVIDWMMAVFSGYFTKALKLGSQGSYTEVEKNALPQDWVSRTKELYSHDHKDVTVV